MSRRAFWALFAALCVSRVVLVGGSADDASSSTPAAGADDLSSRLRDIAADVEANADYVIRLRRELHLVPELMWTEVKTSAIVKRVRDAHRVELLGGVGVFALNRRAPKGGWAAGACAVAR